MKKLINILLVIVIFLLSTHLSVFAEELVASESSSMATPSAKVSYDLPYPGILPDSFLYKIKTLRDKFALFLISDPRRKIDYYLLQADKGILAAAILVDKKNYSLSQQTALRAEHNMTLLSDEIGKLPTKPEDELFAKLKKASLKHQEVLESLIKRVSKDNKKTFEQVVEFSKSNLHTYEEYQSKNSKRWRM